MTRLLNHITTINHIHQKVSETDLLNVFTAIISFIYIHTLLLQERNLRETYEDLTVSPINTKYIQRNYGEKYNKQLKHLTYFAK